MAIKALGFDIDGTLYPHWMMILSGFPSFITNPRLFIYFSRSRQALRENPDYLSHLPFRKRQTRIISQYLKTEENRVGEILDRNFYKLWERSFRLIKPFAGLKHTLEELSNRGYPLGVLSDFPVGDKLSFLGVESLFSCALSAEDCGYLKPHKKPFLILAETLGFPPEEILYVGNSYSKDIVGAKAAGMSTALIINHPRSHYEADIQFSNYRELPANVSALEEKLLL